MASDACSISTGEAPAVPPRRGKLLIVDDEPGPRMALRVIFKDKYDLFLAEDGPTAIDLVQQQDIDVAILDIRMAGMSGIEVLERLRFIRPNIEVIMMTAFETTDTMRQALRLRACDYINKPFDVGTIRAAVEQAMQRRLLESEIHSSAEKVQEILTQLQNEKVEGQIARAHNDIYASILHDINGPLTVIYGFVQLLIKKLDAESGVEAEDLNFVLERLRLMERQAANCIEIQRRYLGFLRRRSGESAAVGVNHILRDLDHLVRVHPSLQGNEFALNPLAGDVVVKVNGTDVIQILLNLTVNAFQATSTPHRVEVGGEVLDQPLALSSFKDGPNDRLLNVESMANTVPLVKLWVRDNGPGIPAEVLPKIFQPYFTTKGPRQGTGLGLNIVQRLVKESDGALHCHTRPGEGTTFTVYLPGAVL